jgi:hypothetical protein
MGLSFEKVQKTSLTSSSEFVKISKSPRQAVMAMTFEN